MRKEGLEKLGEGLTSCLNNNLWELNWLEQKLNTPATFFPAPKEFRILSPVVLLGLYSVSIENYQKSKDFWYMLQKSHAKLHEV